MNAELHPKLRQIIDYYLELVHQARPGLVEGLYIYGSIALGDYSLTLSDIDFITVTSERLKDEEIERIAAIHRKVRKAYKKPIMNGIYITWGDLGKLEHHIAPYPHYYDGRMHKSGYFELNLVTWDELKRHGIAIMGPSPSELPFSVDWDQLISSMHTNLNTYWKNWMKRAHGFSLLSAALLISGGLVEWGVLGITRQYYTFREHDITTKGKAGEYALRVVPEKWHKILRESVNYRRGVAGSSYTSKAARKADALAYMAFIANECNRMFEPNP